MADLRSDETTKTRGKSWLIIVLSIPMVFFLAIPFLSLLLRFSPFAFADALADRQVEQAITLSAVTTGITTLLTVVAGTPLAYLLARRRFTGATLLDSLIDVPILLPPAVAGIALLLAFGRRGVLGLILSEAGIGIPFTETAVILAQLFVAAPLYIKSALSGLASIDRELEQAAEIDGASSWNRFRLITLPLAGHALARGAIMTWARALGEFGATIIFAGNLPGRTQTMPLAIYMGFEIDLRVALTLALILLVISFVVLVTVKRFFRQPVLTL